MKKLKVTITLMLIAAMAFAQRPSLEERVEQRIARLDGIVGLSDIQKQQVSEIYMSGAEEMRALRGQGEPDREKMRTLKEAQNEKVAALLSAEQQEKLKASQEERKSQRKEGKKEIRKYHKDNVKPLMQAKRAEFEKSLSSEERSIIEKARQLRPKMGKKDRKAMTSEERSIMKAKRQEVKEMLKPIVENHKDELVQIKQDLKPAMDEAKAHAKKVRGDQDMSNKKKKMRKKKKEKFAQKFLLMKV